jgi:biopolymer transport protein ExbD
MVPNPAPIAQINITPVIDVMLVLLIMFIITVPVMTHKVSLDLPIGPSTGAPPVIYRLQLDTGGQLSWNGAPIAEASLPGRLGAVRSAPNAQLELSASGEARYEDYDRLLATVKRAGIDRLGLVGNAGFAADLDGNR